jgi:hypothetical protein
LRVLEAEMAEGNLAASPSEAAPDADAAQPTRISVPGILEESGNPDRLHEVDELVRSPLFDEGEDGEEPPTDNESYLASLGITDKVQKELLSRALTGDESALKKVIQQHRTLQGSFRGMEQKAKRGSEAESRFLKANEAARQWQQRAEQIEAQARMMMSQQPAQPSPQPANPQEQISKSLAEEALGSIDKDTYAEIVEKYGDEVARTWKDQAILGHIEKHIQARLDQFFAEKIRPFEEQSEQSEVVDSGRQLFDHVATFQLASGRGVAYPELNDPMAAQEIVRMWATAGWPPNYMFTPRAVQQIVAEYRFIKAEQDAIQAATNQPPEQLSNPPTVDLDSTVAPMARQRGPRSMADDIRDSFRVKDQRRDRLRGIAR